jgi:hypothetical protein
VAKRAAKADVPDAPEAPKTPPEPEGPGAIAKVKTLVANVATGIAGGWKDRIVKGVARPLASGFVLGVGFAIAFGMAIYATFFATRSGRSPRGSSRS